VIEEKVRDEYPDLPQMHKLQPANIEHSTVKGYDLDFPVCYFIKYLYVKRNDSFYFFKELRMRFIG
jgi:hypothetical protein